MQERQPCRSYPCPLKPALSPLTWFNVHLHSDLFDLASGGIVCRKPVILSMKVAQGLPADIAGVVAH